MKRKPYIFRFIFLVLIILIFLAPVIEKKLNLFSDIRLFGVTNPVISPNFTLRSLWSGEAQKQMEVWLDQNNTLKEVSIKVNNQLYYSLFNQTPPNSTISIEKFNQLFEKVYMDEYYRKTEMLDYKLMENKVKEIKVVQDEFTRLGKTFILVITPNKAAIFPEYLRTPISTSEPRNYDLFIPLLDKYGINYVDGHAISVENKVYADIFPQTGTHWSSAGAFFTLQKLAEKINEVSPIAYFPTLQLNEMEFISPNSTDTDLLQMLNVWHSPVTITVPYPDIDFDHSEISKKPSIFMESGSFGFELINLLHKHKLFSDLDFHYYYNTYIKYNEGNPNPMGQLTPENLDWDKEVLNHDIIIKEINETVINLLTRYDFTGDAYHIISNQDIEFIPNDEFVTKTVIEGKEVYHIKKGASGNGTIYLFSTPLTLEPNVTYILTYTAKGFHTLKVDLFPDDLPQYENEELTEEYTEFSYAFTSNSENMKDSRLRIFIDAINGQIPEDTYIYDIKLIKKSRLVKSE